MRSGFACLLMVCSLCVVIAKSAYATKASELDVRQVTLQGDERRDYLEILSHFDDLSHVNYILSGLMQSEDLAVAARARTFRRAIHGETYQVEKQTRLKTKMLAVTWLGLRDPQTLIELENLATNNISAANFILTHILSRPDMVGQVDLAIAAIKGSGHLNLVGDYVLIQPGWEAYPEVWQAAFDREFTRSLLYGAFQESHWRNHLKELVVEVMERMQDNIAHNPEQVRRDAAAIAHVLAAHLKRDESLGQVPENPIYFNLPLLKWLADHSPRSVIENFLSHPRFADSGLVEYLMRRVEPRVAEVIVKDVLTQPHMLKRKDLLELALGNDPRVADSPETCEFCSLAAQDNTQLSFDLGPTVDRVARVNTLMTTTSPAEFAAALTDPELQKVFSDIVAQEAFLQTQNQKLAEERGGPPSMARAVADYVLPITNDSELAQRLSQRPGSSSRIANQIIAQGSWMDEPGIIASVLKGDHGSLSAHAVANSPQYQDRPELMIVGLNSPRADVVVTFIREYLGGVWGAQYPDLLLSAVQHGRDSFQGTERQAIRSAINNVLKKGFWQDSKLAIQLGPRGGKLTYKKLVQHLEQNTAPRNYCSSLFL